MSLEHLDWKDFEGSREPAFKIFNQLLSLLHRNKYLVCLLPVLLQTTTQSITSTVSIVAPHGT
jgi:hypothetical protein